ncbi:MAG: murein hydrolase activator EnvC family protein [Sulfurifustis sp.]
MADPRVGRASGLLACAALISIVAVAAASDPPSEREAEFERLRGRIGRLQRELNETVGRRDAARDQLQAEERRINDLLRGLRDTDERLKRETRAAAELERRRQRSRERLRDQMRALEAQVRAAYAIGREPYLKMLLNQENRAAASRVMAYYRYVAQARVERIGEIQEALSRLAALENEIATSTRELNLLRGNQERERKMLDASRQHRAELLANLDRQVVGQTQEIARLRSDEERLGRLLRELTTIAPEAEIPAPGGADRFGSLKGRLPLPLAGRIAARFGQRKGVGDLTWRGIFLSSKEGQNVHAVSRGRVAFADWLRGFGLLLILDHGDGYMTLYGHNEALYRRAGDWVEAGERIAIAGNTGDAPGTGVYFEIRHNGVPYDPLQWCAAGRASGARR